MNIKKTAKYNSLIQASLELFQTFGFRKVTVEEICQKAGVSKMTFYKFFKNKADLTNHIFQEQFEKGWKQFDEIEEMDIPFTQKVQLLLKLKEENTKKLGKGFMEEYVEVMPEFMKTYKEQYDKGMEKFIQFIKHHQETGEVRASMRPDFFLKMIAKMMELVEDKELVESYASLKDFALEINNFMYYGIMPPPDQN